MVGLEEKTQIEVLREQGLLGSALDPFWNGKMHECCGSPRSYYHKPGCPACGDGMNGELAEEAPLPIFTVPKLKVGAWRIEEQQAKAMYDLYRNGMDGKELSLAQIGVLYRKSRQAVYDIFHSRGWPLRSKKVKEAVMFEGVPFRPDNAGWLRGTIGGKRVYLHKIVWERENGPMPEGYVLTTRDGDKRNLEISNLELVPKKEMAIRFNPERRRNDAASWATRRKNKRHEKRNRAKVREAIGDGAVCELALLRDVQHDTCS